MMYVYVLLVGRINDQIEQHRQYRELRGIVLSLQQSIFQNFPIKCKLKKIIAGVCSNNWK